MLPQYLLRNFIGILRLNCKTGKCTEPASSHRTGVNPIRTKPKAPHTALLGMEEIGHQNQGFLVIDYLLLTSSALKIKI